MKTDHNSSPEPKGDRERGFKGTPSGSTTDEAYLFEVGFIYLAMTTDNLKKNTIFHIIHIRAL